MALHPFQDLTVEEIELCRTLVTGLHPNFNFVFKTITLEEPPKSVMIKFLRAEHEGKVASAPLRIAYCAYHLKGSDVFIHTYVDVLGRKVLSTEKADTEFHGNVDFAEVLEVEEMVMKNQKVLQEIEKLCLPSWLEAIPEAWGWGSDGDDDLRRQYQVYMFAREKGFPDSNHYARPLPFSPVADPVSMKVIRIDLIPTGVDFDLKPIQAYTPTPGNEYVPEKNDVRMDLKPLRVIQPEGTSFQVTPDHVLTWQKWYLRLGFNYREGLVLRDIRYDGWPLFYRVSLSEMTVPYADPRPPYHRKMAFDLGDVGAGLVANNLSLGCDCLGKIMYLDGLISDPDGNPLSKENAVCIHEQDNGIGWKHTNYRTNRACVVRNRELVLQSILTVSNYEYVLAFILNQAGELHYEVRATGILSTSCIEPGLEVSWGTVVHEGVLAAHHQHILSLRIDPFIGDYEDGNRLAVQDTEAMPLDPRTNPYGNGYIAKTTSIEKAGGYDLDTAKSRVFVIQNAKIRNEVNGKAIGCKIHAPPKQGILAHPKSFHYRRAEFADHNVYITKYQDGELFPGSKFTNLSRGGRGIKSWVARGDSVLDTDIVVWVQFGIDHVPRIEDFPVMPVETLKVSLKPYNFFNRSPAVDVAPSTQEANKSQQVFNGSVCCSTRPNGHSTTGY